MSKNIYDNRIDEILDYLKKRIIHEAFTDNIEELINDYEKMANLQFRSLETAQKRDFEIIKKLEKDLNYYKDQEKYLSLIANESVAHKEYKAIVKYLENFLWEVNSGIF